MKLTTEEFISVSTPSIMPTSVWRKRFNVAMRSDKVVNCSSALIIVALMFAICSVCENTRIRHCKARAQRTDQRIDGCLNSTNFSAKYVDDLKLASKSQLLVFKRRVQTNVDPSSKIEQLQYKHYRCLQLQAQIFLLFQMIRCSWQWLQWCQAKSCSSHWPSLMLCELVSSSSATAANRLQQRFEIGSRYQWADSPAETRNCSCYWL